jgi:hypothetical protein
VISVKSATGVVTDMAVFIASVFSAVFHCAMGLFKAADAIAGFVWKLLLCAALLFVAICCLYLASGWIAGIFTGQ